MDSIINKLTEIEFAASAIVQHAEAEKSALDEKFDKKRMDFDKELEADTQRQIQEIRDKLEAETSRILSGQSQESQDELNALQKEYDEKHSDYAHEILRRITEVSPMGNLLEYSGIVTKTRAMEAKLLTPAQFEEIASPVSYTHLTLPTKA